MSIASIIHAHSYHLERQVLDGVHGGDGVRERRKLGKRRAEVDESLKERANLRATSSSSSTSSTSSSSSSPPIVYIPPSASSFYIPTLPGLDPDSTLTLFGGHLPSTITSSTSGNTNTAGTGASSSTSDNAHLFFFLARAKHIAEKEKLVLWLNGGPGCSSFDGALMEIGPLRMVEGKKGILTEQQGAWNEYANVLFLDQPAGTGYSYVSGSHFVHSGSEAAQQIVTFLHNFYEIFPEYERMDLYIAGESFAGIWIPYLADALQKTTLVNVNLRGLMIGNGWIDPYSQYPAYVEFAYATKLIKPSTAPADRVEAALARCSQEMKRIGRDKFPINNGICENILGTITETTLQQVNGKKYCVNNYDIRLTDTHPECGMNWPNLLPDMYAYLPRKDVVSAFHATGKTATWVECNGHVSDSFWASTKPSVGLLPGLLESGLPILLFSGMQDLICNHVGTEKMIANMVWSGSAGFGNNTEPLDWYVDGENAGTWTTARNLTYVQVYNASHMVPFDVPVIAHDMFSRFTSTDYISAAGAAALVPSRIGNEQEAIVGETHPNGSAIDPLLEEIGTGSGTGTGKSSSNDINSSSSAGASPAADAFYNIGAALLVLVLFLAVGAAFFYRQRRRRRPIFSNGFSSSNSIPNGKGGGLSGHLHQHRRNRSSASDRFRQSIHLGDGEGDMEETNELLPLQGDRKQDQRNNRDRESLKIMQERNLPKGEELFAVGEEEDDDEEEEDSEEEGNLGRPGRRLSGTSPVNGKGYDVV